MTEATGVKKPAQGGLTDRQVGCLALKWLRAAGSRFKNSELEPNEMGAKLIHHGGMVHFNCAMALLDMAGIVPDEAVLAERGETLCSFLLKEFGEDSKGP